MLPGIYKCFEHWCNQTVWIYSDPHFNDEDLAGGIDRPSAEAQIQKINFKVGRKDTLIILGDIGDIECVRQLRGYKVLIAGNHDIGLTNYQRQKIYRKFDDQKYSYEEVKAAMQSEFPGWKISISKGYDLIHAPFTYFEVEADNALFDEVYGGPLFIGEKLLLTHEPVDIPFAFNIHGHDHAGKAFKDKRHLNVCSDVIKYEPVNLNQFLRGGISHVESIHRQTIDGATKRKKARGGKKLGH